MLLGMTTEVSDWHREKELFPRLTTLFGISIDFRELSKNVFSPIVVTPLGTVTDIINDSSNAWSPMDVTGYPPKEDGIVIVPSVPKYPVIVATPL
jgi:hypothetical protein